MLCWQFVDQQPRAKGRESKVTVQTCWHTSALPESVQTACSTGGFKSWHNNQAECLNKLDYLLSLTRYLYGQAMITLPVNTLLIQKMSGPWECSWASAAQSSVPRGLLPAPWSRRPCQSPWGPQPCPWDTESCWSPDPPPPGPAQPWALPTRAWPAGWCPGPVPVPTALPGYPGAVPDTGSPPRTWSCPSAPADTPSRPQPWRAPHP